METLSAFRPVSDEQHHFYMILEGSERSFSEDNNKKPKSVKEGTKPKKIDRNWSFNATKFILLKYRYWQLSLRRSTGFSEFLKPSPGESSTNF